MKAVSFRKALDVGQDDLALHILRSSPTRRLCETLVLQSLSHRRAPVEVRDTALRAFLSAPRKNVPIDLWFHSLIHLLPALWERGLRRWVARFHAVAFTEAHRLPNSTYLSRLVLCFVRYADWQDDPADYHLTQPRLAQLDWARMPPHARSRLRQAPFASEADFLRWQFKHPGSLQNQEDGPLPDISFPDLHARIRRLAAKGVNPEEFIKLERALLRREIRRLKRELRGARENWKVKAMHAQIEEMSQVLAELAPAGR